MISSYHNKIGFFNTELTLKAQDLRLKLQLDISKEEVIQDISYSGDNIDELLPGLASLCNLVLNKKVEDADALVSSDFKEDFQERPVILLKKLFSQYRGEYLHSGEQKLICRCFGVGEDEVVTLAKEGREFEQIIEQTNASAGCRSCKNDLLDTFVGAHKTSRRFLGITHSDWIKKTDKLVKDFFEVSSFDYEAFYPVVLFFKVGVVGIKVVENIQLDAFKYSLEKFLGEQLDAKIFISFSF